MTHILQVTDSNANLYTMAVPSKSGEAFYHVMPDGDIIAVLRIAKAATRPEFTLAPAQPTAGEKALNKALEEVQDSISRWEGLD